MVSLAIPVIVVMLTFMAPWWLKIILTLINMLYLPDAVPFVDEALQAYNTFSSPIGCKVYQWGKKYGTAKKSC